MIQITFLSFYVSYTKRTITKQQTGRRIKMRITNNMTIADVVKAYPSAIEIFHDFKIDYCCGGNENLVQAVEKLSLDSKSFLELLNKKLLEKKNQEEQEQRLNIEQLMQMNVEELIAFIIATHHAKERVLLEEVDELVNKVLFVHYANRGEQLIPLHANFCDLRKELLQHFAKEEKVTFPYMKENAPSERNCNYIKELENEHEAAGNIIKEIEACTNHFKAPEGACKSYRLLFQKLQELVEDIYLHIFTENSVLFPTYEGGK